MWPSVLSIGIAFLFTAGACLAGPNIDSLVLGEDRMKVLKNAVKLIDEKLVDDNIQWLNEQLKPGNEPISMLSAAILYKSDSSAYTDVLFKYFTVDDYDERDQGKQNLIYMEKAVAPIGKVESQMGKEISKRKELPFLFAFWYFQDRNEWLAMNDDPPISVARFYRTAFLTAFLSLPAEIVVALANRIDNNAQTQPESKKQ